MAPSHKQWLIPFAVQLIPAGLLIFGCIFIKESPRWLFGRGRREEAIKNLCWMRQLDQTEIYMIEEIGAIDQALEEQRATIGLGFWKPFKAAGTNKRVMWRLFLGSAMFFWQNGSGINAINYYSPTVFKASYRNSRLLRWEKALTTSTEHWYHRRQHWSADNRYFRRSQDCRHLHMAPVAD